MGLGKSQGEQEPPEFGAAADGDADRNMILGKRQHITTCQFTTLDMLTSPFPLLL